MNPETAARHEASIESELSRAHALQAQLSERFPNGIEAGLAHYDSWLRNEMTYTSNAIEGNTLTSAETNLVVNEDAVIPNKSLREHMEARDHAIAWDYLTETVEHLTTISTSDILALHSRVLYSTNHDAAGMFRTTGVRVAGATTVFPNPVKVPTLLDGVVEQINQPPEGLDPLVHTALIHLDFVKIHPFADGNGRTARLLMSTMLRRARFPAIPIYPKDRAAYISAIEEADRDEGAAFTSLIIRLQAETIEGLLHSADGITTE